MEHVMCSGSITNPMVELKLLCILCLFFMCANVLVLETHTVQVLQVVMHWTHAHFVPCLESNFLTYFAYFFAFPLHYSDVNTQSKIHILVAKMFCINECINCC